MTCWADNGYIVFCFYDTKCIELYQVTMHATEHQYTIVLKIIIQIALIYSKWIKWMFNFVPLGMHGLHCNK